MRTLDKLLAAEWKLHSMLHWKKLWVNFLKTIKSSIFPTQLGPFKINFVKDLLSIGSFNIPEKDITNFQNRFLARGGKPSTFLIHIRERIFFQT